MYKMKKLNLERKKFNSKGITLVALVVTIIILLVLAGITVASLTGDNGLIGKTGEAKKQTEISEGLEQLEIAVTQSTNKRGNIDETKLAKNLSKINGLKYINAEKEEIDVEENTEIKLTAKVKFKGNTFKIKKDGKISYKKDGTIDNEDIRNVPATYYGRYVTNYNSPNDEGIVNEDNQLGKWQIFMADEDNIFLITSNFITGQYTGKKNNVEFSYEESNPTKIWFKNIINQYNVSNDLTKNDIPGILSKLDKQSIYHKWMNKTENQIKGNNNEKAVAAMLDVDLWNGYNNPQYAKYAIGGPTLEMFCEAYNATHSSCKIKAKENYNTGYKIQKNNDNDSETISLSGWATSPVSESAENMLMKTYWMAAPSSAYHSHIITPYESGINYNSYNNKISFKPIACLNSNVHLVENKDENNNITYELELD